MVWTSIGTGFNAFEIWDKTAEGEAYAYNFSGRVVSGDFNGDGKQDISGIYEYPGEKARIFVWKSQTTSFTSFEEKYNLRTTYTIEQLTGKIVCEDYNEDGKADLGLISILNNKGAIHIFNSTGTVYNSPEELWTTEDVISYKYNDNGIRTSKTVGGVETKYYLDGSKVIYEKTGEDVIYYSYDENGQVIGMNRNGTQYYYIKNAQNDVIGLLDNTLQQIVSYKNIQAGEK